MSLVAKLQPTLMDLAARYGQTPESAVIEILSASNELLDDMVWVEANDGTGHKTTIRTGLPKGAWRLLNYGVPAEKSATAAVRDTCGLLESYSEVDKQLYDMEQNPQEWRASEDAAFVEGMSQTMGETLIYGNARDTPAAFTGFICTSISSIYCCASCSSCTCISRCRWRVVCLAHFSLSHYWFELV